jgi:hypothetical protein
MIGALDGAIVEGRMRQDSFVGIGYEIQRYSWLAGQQLGDVWPTDWPARGILYQLTS